MPQSNPHFELKPRTEFSGTSLEFDFPGLLIGCAEYDEGPTGCTVFRFPKGAVTAIDVRGGMVGVSQDYDYCHAICLAGGSLLGMEAFAGVAAAIFAEGDFDIHKHMPFVNGAIIYDYGPRQNTVHPDFALGKAAYSTAKPSRFWQGQRGAGRSATVGKALGFHRAESGGQGGAFRQVEQTKIAVFTVVNSLGAIYDRSGQIVRGNINPETKQRETVVETLEQYIEKQQNQQPPAGNTTLTVVVTNLNLESGQLNQLGRMVHSSMARAIQPFHTMFDGDVLYTATTAEVEEEWDLGMLGIIASEVAWDAILASVSQD